MRILIASDMILIKNQERIYAKYAYSSILERYHDQLGPLCLCCRVKAAEQPSAELLDITPMVCKLVPISNKGALLNCITQEHIRLVETADLVICRMPSFSGICISGLARKMHKPVFSEVMGCGWDAYWNHSLAGKIIAPYVFFKTRQRVRNSDYALYVTESFLQKRYPCPNPSVGVSDVVIPGSTGGVREKRHRKIQTMDPYSITLMTSAAVNVFYKGQHYVIRAIPKLNQMGIRVRYYCVGQGDQGYLKKVAAKCGVEDQVIFTGAVAHDRVFALLDECDIYVQPSLQEGLPRALAEAMSRGCPALGARTGGIPELLPEECITERRLPEQIAERISTMLKNGLERYSAQNFRRALDFQKEVLDQRRNDYFARVKREIEKKTLRNER